MKRLLLYFCAVAIAVAAVAGCSQQRKWNAQQRKQMREMLREYRQAAYLEDLTDAEYVVFTDGVAADIEADYPVYTTFMQMPAVDDTVTVYVVTNVASELEADVRNMRHLFPYRDMVEGGVLPSGLENAQQNAFYSCMADKINAVYGGMAPFYWALLADTATVNRVSRFQAACASDLFDWEVDIVEIFD